MIISTNDGASENEVQVFNSGIVAGMQEGTDAKRMCHPELIELSFPCFYRVLNLRSRGKSRYNK